MRDAIDGLYTAFASYERPKTFDACTCCIPYPDGRWGDMGEHARLPSPGGTTPLRDIPADELYAFADNVPGTCGDLPTYKHYLPRILEIAQHLEPYDDAFPELETMLGRLHTDMSPFVPWLEWPAEEVAAIRVFLDACWDAACGSDDIHVTEGVLSALIGIDPDIDRYLDAWSRTGATPLAQWEVFSWLERPSSEYAAPFARGNWDRVKHLLEQALLNS